MNRIEQQAMPIQALSFYMYKAIFSIYNNYRKINIFQTAGETGHWQNELQLIYLNKSCDEDIWFIKSNVDDDENECVFRSFIICGKIFYSQLNE
jgi:hypothetical protein